MARPSWLTINPGSGNGNGTIQFSGTEHTGRVARTYVATVSNSKKIYSVSIPNLGALSKGTPPYAPLAHITLPYSFLYFFNRTGKSRTSHSFMISNK